MYPFFRALPRWARSRFAGTSVLCCFAIAWPCLPVSAQSSGENIVRIDASAAYTAPRPAGYDEGSAKSPAGATLGVNGRYLTLNGKPDRVAEAPDSSDMSASARWSIVIPPDALRGLSNLYLQIHYVGDVARLEFEKRLLTDNFFNGQPWTIGLRRFLGPEGKSKFTLSILPLRKDAPIYLELSQPIDYSNREQAIGLDTIGLEPEYQLIIGGAAH